MIRIAIQHSFSLRQHITRKSKILINHVISAIPSGVIYHNIVHTEEISNHDALYVIFNIKKDKYQPHQKFIHNKQTLDMNSYTYDFQHLPLKDVINPYNCLLKKVNFSVKTRNE